MQMEQIERKIHENFGIATEIFFLRKMAKQ